MSRNIILVAGILIACALCAGIPAVSAAENTHATVTAPAPVMTPVATAPATPPGTTPHAASAPAEEKAAAEKTAEPEPWYTPIGEVFGLHADNASQPAPATGSTTDNRPWWEKLWPVNDTRATDVTPVEVVVSAGNEQGQEKSPATVPETTPLTRENPLSNTANHDITKENPKTVQGP